MAGIDDSDGIDPAEQARRERQRIIQRVLRLHDDITANYHGGHPNSVAAWRSISDDARQKTLERVFAWFQQQEPHGATTDEAIVALGEHQSISPRVTNLKAGGALVWTEERRLTRTGRAADVFRIAPRFRHPPEPAPVPPEPEPIWVQDQGALL